MEKLIQILSLSFGLVLIYQAANASPSASASEVRWALSMEEAGLKDVETSVRYVANGLKDDESREVSMAWKRPVPLRKTNCHLRGEMAYEDMNGLGVQQVKAAGSLHWAF